MTYNSLSLGLLVLCLFAIIATLQGAKRETEELFRLVSENQSLVVIETYIRNNHANIEINGRSGRQAWSALIAASNSGFLESVRLLLHYGADPNLQEADGFTSLLFAAHHGYVQVVQALLHRGSNIYHTTATGQTALSLASTDQVRSVLQKHIDTMREYSAGSAFLEQCRLGRLEEVENMVNQRGRYIINGEVNEAGWSCLTFAASSANDGLLRFLLVEGGASPNTFESDNWSPLMFAVKNKCSECVELLLEAGATIGEVDDFEHLVLLGESHGEIISMLAGEGLRQHLERKRVLIGGGYSVDAGAILKYVVSGANANVANRHGVTSLMLLSQTGEFEAARDIIRYGSDVNWQEEDGWTAVMFAVHADHFDIVKLLIENDETDLDAENKHQETALDIARQLGRRSIAAALEQAGAGVGQATRALRLGGGEDAEDGEEELEGDSGVAEPAPKKGVLSFFGF